MKFYQYKNCSTCRKAQKWLDAQGVDYEMIDITQQPPSVAELETMLAGQDGTLRKLFNTSGLEYRALDMKTRLPGMPTDEALGLLSGNGKLVKRPFLIGDGVTLVGFKEEDWQGVL